MDTRANTSFRHVVEPLTPKPLNSTFLPQARAVTVMSSEWKIYRTRFLIRAKQLTEPLRFVDFLGREHHGRPGDYLVETSDGVQRIASREIFEDIYVAMGPAELKKPAMRQTDFSLAQGSSASTSATAS